MGEFVPQPWVVLGRRLHREQGAVQIQVRAEFAVQTKAALAILVQWVVLRHRRRARTTARAMLCGFLKCCCTVESIASLSFQPWVLAASTHCQTAPTCNGRCACLKRFVGEARSLAADRGTPEYHGDACDALRRPEMLGGPLHICKLRRVFVVGRGERLRVGHEERSNGATSSQQWQSSSASVRGHEMEIHAHPRDAAETGHGGWPLANERRLADGQDVVREVGAATHAAIHRRYVVTSRLRGQGSTHLHRRRYPLG